MSNYHISKKNFWALPAAGAKPGNGMANGASGEPNPKKFLSS
jgi:hypothetical protein